MRVWNKAYTLVELSIVLTILAILAAGGLTIFSKKTEADLIKLTKDRMDAIERAILDYYQVNGYIPCPSDATQDQSSEIFGLHADGTFTPTDTYDTTNDRCYYFDACTSTNSTMMCDAGIPPVKLLNLPDEYALDGWGRRFTYRVSTKFGNYADFSDQNSRGDISVVDTQGNELTDINRRAPFNFGAAYVLFSSGPNGYYAWQYDSGTSLWKRLVPTSGTTQMEFENQDHSADRRYVQDNRAVYFDDIMRFKKKSDIEPPRLIVSPMRISQPICNTARLIVDNGTGTLSASGVANVPQVVNVTYESAKTIVSLCAGKMQTTENCIPGFVWAGSDSGRPFPVKLMNDCQPNGVQAMSHNVTSNFGTPQPAFTLTLTGSTHCNTSGNTNFLNSQFYVNTLYNISITRSGTVTNMGTGALQVRSVAVTGTAASPTWGTADSWQNVNNGAATFTFTQAGVLQFAINSDSSGSCADNTGTYSITIE